MWIELDCTRAKVTRATDAEDAWLNDYLSFPDARARFRPGGDGMIRMYNSLHGWFPAGLVALVRKAAAGEQIPVQVADATKAEPVDPAADLAWLRDDQREAIVRVTSRRRGILHIPTGAGKTEIAVGLTRSVPTARWLFLVHRTTLGDQAAERFMRRNAEHGVDLGMPGIVGEGRWEDGDHLTCATFQTLVKALKKDPTKTRAWLAQFGGVIVDECHVLPADTFWEVAMATVNAAYRVGLSGTPLARGDRRSVQAIAALGPVIYRLKADVLIEAGILAKPKIKMIVVAQNSPRPTWQGVYGDLVVRSRPRNAALVEMAKRCEKPGLLFVKEVAHGKALEKALLVAGVRAGFVWGSHSTDYRKSMISRLTRGDLDVLVCSVVFQEGVDIPCLRSVIVGSGGRSVIAAIQRVGRGTRIERNARGEVIKDSFEVWDVADRGQDWMERAAKERRRAYIREGYETIELPELRV